MSYESSAEPIKLGYLMDFTMPPGYPQEQMDDLSQSMQLEFKKGREAGIIDRDVEIIYKEVEGLPKGSVKAVIDAYEELCNQGCVLIYGPMISDNAVAAKPEIEKRFQVPSLTITGTEDWLGEWTFSLPQGSLTDEPVVWAWLIRKRGLKTVGVVMEKSFVGESYIKNFRSACEAEGLQIVIEQSIAQTAQDVDQAIKNIHALKPDALVHCGFGFGVVHVNPALEALDWDPPRFMGTAFQNAWINPVMWKAIEGWIGLDQYDEGNAVGQAFLDEYEEAFGRRPEYCVPVVNRDLAAIMLKAFSDAHPLSPLGVKEALERVKMLPAASGAPGTRLSFGKWMRRGWVGSGYLVARKLDPDGVNSHLVDRFGEE